MVYIIRHGKTDWNNLKKLQGKTDIPLNAEGIAMAQKVAEECKKLNFDICFSSPLKRARQTADILLKDTCVPIKEDSRLEEMGFGIYEGSINCHIDPNCPIYSLFNSPEKYKNVEGGESLDELYNRTKEFLDEIVYPLNNDGKNILIVGHGAMNSCIINQISNKSRSHFWDGMTDNCKLVRII